MSHATVLSFLIQFGRDICVLDRPFQKRPHHQLDSLRHLKQYLCIEAGQVSLAICNFRRQYGNNMGYLLVPLQVITLFFFSFVLHLK